MTNSAPDTGRGGRPELALSIIIVSYRSWDDLGRCLDSIASLADSGDSSAEIIVVDNDSDASRRATFAADYPSVRFIESAGNYGFAYGCNRGAREATGAELLFLNPDARDPRGVISRFLEAKRERPGVAILTVRQVDARGAPQRIFGPFPTVLNLTGPARALLRLLKPGAYPDPRARFAGELRVDWVSGAALMISRAALDRLGGWCEDFWMYSEDVDLCRRAANQGMIVACRGDIVLEHRHGGSSRADSKTAALTRAEVVISRHLYAHRHLGRLHAGMYHLLVALTRWVPLMLPALLARLWSGAPEPIQVRAGAFGELSRHYDRILTTRNWISPRSVNHRSAGTNELR